MAEAMEAANVLRAGGGAALEVYFPQLEAPLLEAALILNSAFSRFEADRMKPKTNAWG